jgi:D-glycero-alpha-D-manno-heptose-7-phosphate kinase
MIVSRTPLRVSLAGGGTDFPEFFRRDGGGCVVSTAIDKYLYVILKRRFDTRIRVNYSRTEIVDEVAAIQHDLVRESLRWTGIERAVEIATMADVPSEGSGLGSSSSLTVGLLSAMYAYQGVAVAPARLAHEAYVIEREVLGRPVGCQDAYIAAYGGLRFLQFCRDEAPVVTPIAADAGVVAALDERLLLFYTGLTRRADEILHEQEANIPRHIDLLAEMRDQARELQCLLAAGDVSNVGHLLDRGWNLKRQLGSRISSPWIDALYERALATGAEGGKVAGAGGGGFLLLSCPVERQAALRAALSALQELPFRCERGGSCLLVNL